MLADEALFDVPVAICDRFVFFVCRLGQDVDEEKSLGGLDVGCDDFVAIGVKGRELGRHTVPERSKMAGKCEEPLRRDQRRFASWWRAERPACEKRRGCGDMVVEELGWLRVVKSFAVKSFVVKSPRRSWVLQRGPWETGGSFHLRSSRLW